MVKESNSFSILFPYSISSKHHKHNFLKTSGILLKIYHSMSSNKVTEDRSIFMLNAIFGAQKEDMFVE